MKFRRTAASAVVSIVLVLAVLCAVLFFHASTKGISEVRNLINALLEIGDSGSQITMDGMDGTLMKGLALNRVVLSGSEGNRIASIERVDVSVNIWRLMCMALGIGNRTIDVTLSNVDILADETNLDSLSLIIDSFSSQADAPETPETEGSKHGFAKALDSCGINISIINMSLNADLGGIEAHTAGINATAVIDKGFSFKEANLNVPKVGVSMEGLDRSVNVNDIRVSVDSSMTAYMSIADASFGDDISFSAMSAIATIKESVISAALFVDGAEASLMLDETDLDASVAELTVNADYNTGSGSLSFSLRAGSVSASSKALDARFSVRDTGFSGALGQDNELSLQLSSGRVAASLQSYSLSGQSIGGDLGLNISRLSSIGQITVRGLSLNGVPYMDRLGASSLELDYSYSDTGAGIRIRSAVSGKAQSPYVDEFRFDLDASAQMKGTAVDFAEFTLQNISLAALKNSASLSLYLNSSGIGGGFEAGEDLNASFNYSYGRLGLNLYLDEFVPYEYKTLYKNLLEPAGVVAASTVVGGNIVASVDTDKAFSDYLAALYGGDYSASYSASDLFDILDDGRFSLNLAVRDLMVGDEPYSGAVTLESTIDENIATISTLAVTALGMRLSYQGTIDFLDLIPEGTLLLQSASDGSEMAQVLFTHPRGSKRYEFSLTSPYASDAAVDGLVDWQDLGRVVASVAVKTPLFGEEGLSLDAVVTLEPLRVLVTGDRLDLDLGLDDEGILNLTGKIKEFPLIFSEDLSMTMNSALGGRYNAETSEFAVSLGDFSVLLSNGLGVGFDLDFSSHALHVGNLFLKTAAGSDIFSGSADFAFGEIADLIQGITGSLDGTVDFTSSDNISYFRVSATDDQYYLDFNYDGKILGDFSAGLTIVGQRNHPFYGDASVVWGEKETNRFNISMMYDDKVFTVYDSMGRMGSLQFNDMNLRADFSDMVLEGSMKVLNENTFTTGDVVSQGATISLSAKVESLATGIMQLISGEEYSMDFELGISDVKLADGFTVDDSTVDLNFSNGIVKLSGNLVSGQLDLQSGRVDVDIDRSFIFGLNAHGYLWPELDLVVTDIKFPLTLLNQIMDSPMMAFTDGLIEGEVLIKGKASNPSLYGMAYCQSYGMSLFYLPDQVITAKNVAVSMQDHTISISRTAMSGYSEADGRYFKGDVALELVMMGLKLDSFEVSLNIDKETPIDFRYTQVSGFEMEIRGDVTGYVLYGTSGDSARLETDIVISNMLVDFVIDDELPSWYYKYMTEGESSSTDITLRMTTGQNVEFYYPEKDNSFINFTLSEDKTVTLFIDADGTIRADGGFALKTGQVYYFHNDFIIREGSVDLTARNLAVTSSTMPLVLNLTADITDYDSSGNKVVISLILQNATLDNISPRFTSAPLKDENEILAMLGQSVVSSTGLDQSLSLTTLASLAATATDALTRVGILESNKSYSIAGTVRSALGLDIFSARSNIISNVIIDALPGTLASQGEISMLARYLDGTSIFAGKYVGSDWFVKLRLMLKAENNVKNSSERGHFLAKDLILDTELSLDWDTPMGTVSIFTNPHELSVFDILDTIGFSVTKQIQF